MPDADDCGPLAWSARSRCRSWRRWLDSATNPGRWLAGFNREEHLRPVPPGDPDHDRLYGRRNDTESGNRLLDDSMLRERAHTVGHRRQLLNLTTWAALRDASAAHQHARPDTTDPPAAISADWSNRRAAPDTHSPPR